MEGNAPEPQDQDEIDRHVGSMIRWAATADIYLGLIAQQLCDSPYAGYLVAGESTRRTIDLCKKLLQVYDDITEDQRAEIKDLLKQVGQLVDERDRYVHGAAIPDQLGAFSTFRARRGQPEPEIVPIDLEALGTLTKQYKRLSMQLGAWHAMTFFPELANAPDED